MMSMQTTTPPKHLVAPVLGALKANDEVDCFQALLNLSDWAKENTVEKVTLTVEESLHEDLTRRISVLKKKGHLPETLTITLVATSKPL